jgi:hypothetical protein
VTLTPFCGMISVPVLGDPFCAQNVQAPLAVTVGVPRLLVHVLNTGVPIGPQTGPEGF